MFGLPLEVVVVLLPIIGGIVGGLISPIGQDLLNERQHRRAEATRIATAKDAEQAQAAAALVAERAQAASAAAARKAERRTQRGAALDRLEQAIVGYSQGLITGPTIVEWRVAPAICSEIGDPYLSEYMGRLQASDRATLAWQDTRTDALHRIGELRREMRDED